jgi:hypothetical protein
MGSSTFCQTQKPCGSPPTVRQWILKGCDVNKDIEISRKAKLTLPDKQIPFFEKTLRAYVKPIGDKVFYRVELSLARLANRTGFGMLEERNNIDADCFSLSYRLLL